MKIMESDNELHNKIMENDIDAIVDDEEFCETENDFIMQYCIDKKFKISDLDLEEIHKRGLIDAFFSWKDEWEYDNKQN